LSDDVINSSTSRFSNNLILECNVQFSNDLYLAQFVRCISKNDDVIADFQQFILPFCFWLDHFLWFASYSFSI